MEGRPFNLVTPRYDEDFREQAGTVKTDWRFTDQYYSRKNQERLAEAPQVQRHGGGDHRRNLNVSAFDIDYLNKVPVRGRRWAEI